MAHILNLIVKDGLKDQNFHIEVVQKAVQYVRKSTKRILKFKKCMKDCGMEFRKFLCGDCPTRWNSTHNLLKSVVALEDVFIKYEVEDKSYAGDLVRVPKHHDFRVCQGMVDFFEKFKSKTELVSGTSNPLVHLFLREILDVNKHLREWETKSLFCLTGGEMRKKYDKYWGDFEKISDFMYFAVLLDPTMKSSFLKHVFRYLMKYKNIKDDEVLKVSSLIKETENKMDNFFNHYKEKFETIEVHGESQECRNDSNEDVCIEIGNEFLGDFLNVEGSNLVAPETELKRYLQEPKAPYKNGFDILNWWKQNSMRFPIISRIAKDILGIQISTVASKSAFSTSGRILDPYRTRLSPTITETEPICIQDWVRKSRQPIVDNVEDILNDDDIA